MTQQDLDTLSKGLRTVAAKTLPAGDLTSNLLGFEFGRIAIEYDLMTAGSNKQKSNRCFYCIGHWHQTDKTTS